jgi:exodeoxyribonuclease V gamma subunit
MEHVEQVGVGGPDEQDRQRHHDERNLFLDLVLAARERLHLSYVGKDRKDNAKLPPSVVLSELIDALVPALCDKGSTKDQKESIRRALVIEHPLQAFSEVYFQGERERSFRKTFAQALQERARNLVAVSAKQQEESSSGQFFKHDQGDGEGGGEENSQLEQELDRQAFGRCAPFFEGLGHQELEPEWLTVQLSQLILFIQNPVRFFLTQRLGLELPWVEREWPETEDFFYDG